MGKTYDVNEFSEVVPYTDGRRSTCTSEYRELTGYEEQLRAEVTELEAENKRLQYENEKLKERIEKAKVTFFETGSDADTAVNMYNILRGE